MRPDMKMPGCPEAPRREVLKAKETRLTNETIAAEQTKPDQTDTQ
jgi:hypothetical protein